MRRVIGSLSGRLSSLVAGASLACALGCTSPEPSFHGSAPPASAAPAEAAPARPEPRCPMEVPGTSPRAVRLADGAAIDFVTGDGSEVEELRRQVTRKVHVHQEHHREPSEVEPLDEAMLARMSEVDRERMRHRWNRRRLIGTSTVTGEAIEGGMRVKLVPADPAELDALYGSVEETTRDLIAFGARCPEEDEH